MQNVDELLRKHELNHLKSSIMSELKTSIRMRKVNRNEEAMPLGSSKLGGLPDMPDGMEFPKYHNGYLSFMAQINLAEVKPFDRENVLPEKGILYLFYDAVEQPWGFDEDAGCFKVLYFDGDMAELKRKEYPKQTEDFYPLPVFQVEFEQMYTISEQPESLEWEGEDDEENFWEFRAELMQPEDDEGCTMPAHYMLGEPLSIQNDVFEELYDRRGEPVLLFQSDSDEEDLGVLWGDSGLLYFCLQKEELLNKEFDKMKFTLQCF